MAREGPRRISFRKAATRRVRVCIREGRLVEVIRKDLDYEVKFQERYSKYDQMPVCTVWVVGHFKRRSEAGRKG